MLNQSWSRPAAKRVIPGVGRVNVTKTGQGGENTGNGELSLSALAEGTRKGLRVEQAPRVAERGEHGYRSFHVAGGKYRLLLLVGDGDERRLQLLLVQTRKSLTDRPSRAMLCVAKAGGQMTGKIFLSYRREDAAGFALALFGRLEQSFPSERLFMDVEGGIGAGQDFVRVIEDEVSLCDVMLVLIGPDWLTVTDEAGRRRLENPEDFVRIEVESALKFGKRVIPVLVHKTEMPRADALPEPLKALARRNAVGLTQERFKADAQGLIKALEDALAEVEDARRQLDPRPRPPKSSAPPNMRPRRRKRRDRKKSERGLTPSPACHRNRSPRRKSWPTGISSRPAKAARNSAITWPASRKG